MIGFCLENSGIIREPGIQGHNRQSGLWFSTTWVLGRLALLVPNLECPRDLVANQGLEPSLFELENGCFPESSMLVQRVQLRLNDGQWAETVEHASAQPIED